MAQTNPDAGPVHGMRPGLLRTGRQISLRHALWRLLSWSLLPLAIGLCWGVWDQWQSQRESAQRQLAVAAETLALAVGRDVAAHLEKLRALAASPLIDERNWGKLDTHARNVVASQPGALIAVTQPSGQQVVNTGLGRGEALPNTFVAQRSPKTIVWEGKSLPVGSQGLSKRVFETGKPAYSGLYYGLTVKRPTVSVVIPVIRDERVAYTMTLAFPPQSLADLVGSAKAATPGTRAAVLDQDGLVIASNANSAARMGVRARPLDSASGDSTPTVVGQGTTRDGVAVHVALARLETTGWSVRLAAPDDEVLGPARQATYFFGAITALAVLLGGFLASLLARRLAAPLRQLAMAARDLQNGKDVDLPQSRIEEVDELGQALSNAARSELQRREEAQARAVAEEREAATRRTALSLRASEERLRRLIDNLRPFVAVLDLDGTLVEVNQAALARAGLVREQVIGRPFWEAYWWSHDAAVQAQLREAIDKARHGVASHYPVQVRIGPAELLWIDFALAPLTDPSGTITNLIPSGVDISERVRTEAALRDADRQKDQFIATLAHELRNPLSPIRTASEIIKLRRPTDAAIMRAQEMIERQATQMARLVDDLLDISRITFGRIELRRQACSLSELLGQSVESMRALIEEAGHRLDLRLPDDPLRIEADPARINQIMLNVLGNAVRFTPPGGTIAVSAGREGSEAKVCIADTGIGIEPGMLELIFEMFVQERPSGFAGSTGLGIGLGLARKLAAMHGGTLVGRSEGPGCGSEFILRLPLSQGAEVQPEPREATGTHAQGLRILVVDDNVDAAESLKVMLELQGGHRVDAAFDGRSAVKAFESLRHDVVVLDIGLPDISGHEVARTLRALEGDRRTLLIALTGWGQEADRGRALDAGFDHHVTKPAPPERLLELIDAARSAASPGS